MELIIVTGLSGAGRRSVLGALEDAGYVALDNVPFQLLGPLLELEKKAGTGNGRLAVGIDSRHLGLMEDVGSALGQFQGEDVDPFIIYLECDDDVLIRRYSESRRPHRMAEGGSVADGIARERVLLGAVKGAASMVIDTSALNLYQLRQRIAEKLPKSTAAGTNLNLVSFGFKHGLPAEADMVFDARFLPNPYYVPALRPLTGRDAEIVEYLGRVPEFGEYLGRMEGIVLWLWPQILKDTRAYHTVAIGCTGGRHRSVALVECLAARLAGRLDHGAINVRHRDMAR